MEPPKIGSQDREAKPSAGLSLIHYGVLPNQRIRNGLLAGLCVLGVLCAKHPAFLEPPNRIRILRPLGSN